MRNYKEIREQLEKTLFGYSNIQDGILKLFDECDRINRMNHLDAMAWLWESAELEIINKELAEKNAALSEEIVKLENLLEQEKSVVEFLKNQIDDMRARFYCGSCACSRCYDRQQEEEGRE